MRERFDRDTARRILDRAAELHVGGDLDPAGFDPDTLAAAADEVGIAPEAVYRAVAEHRTGALSEAPRSRNLLGPATVVVSETIDRPAPEVRRALDSWMTKQMLSVARRRGETVTWRRRDDLLAKVRRRVDFAKRLQLDQVDEVTIAVTAVDDVSGRDDGRDARRRRATPRSRDAGGRSIVRVEVNLSNTRRGLWTGAVAFPAIAAPLTAVALGVFVGEPLVIAAGVPAGAALGGGGLWIGRRTLADGRQEAERAVELALGDLTR